MEIATSLKHIDELESVVAGRLKDAAVPVVFADNYRESEAFSCRQAVKVRSRVGSGGNGGIPLWAELKSFVGGVFDANGGLVEAFAAHARANCDFVPERLLEILGHESSKHTVKELVPSEGSPNEGDGESDSWFGLVNPFVVDLVISEMTGTHVALQAVRQVVDYSVDLNGGVPDTLMTNAGSRTRSIEMTPTDLVRGLSAVSPATVSGQVCEPSQIWLGLGGRHRKHYWLQLPPPSGPKIGILTGNGPDSGRTLLQDLLESLRDAYTFLPDVLMPPVVVNSIPAMGLSMELVQRRDEVGQVVLAGVEELLETGCKLVTVACNTSIFFDSEIRDLCGLYDATFVSIAHASVEALEAADATAATVGLVGIGPVIDLEGGFSGYKAPLEDRGFDVAPCDGGTLAYHVKSQGDDDPRLVTEFRSLMRDMPDVVILALTEVSMLYRRHKAKLNPNRPDSRTYIDPLAELGRELAFQYLVRGYLESEVCQMQDAPYVSSHVRKKLGS